jgi:hypothetical protein
MTAFGGGSKDPLSRAPQFNDLTIGCIFFEEILSPFGLAVWGERRNGSHQNSYIPKIGELNNISIFENVELVGGEAKNDHVVFVSFGDLMKDRRALFVYTSHLLGLHLNVV